MSIIPDTSIIESVRGEMQNEEGDNVCACCRFDDLHDRMWIQPEGDGSAEDGSSYRGEDGSKDRGGDRGSYRSADREGD